MSSLYLHIPFCSSKCPYCDFFSQVGPQQQIDEYVELLCLNIDVLQRKTSSCPPFKTIFFGGGTPSLLSVKQVERLLSHLERSFGIVAGAEVSLEANPGTVNLERLRGYRQAGVNRLSLGIQSLNEQSLQQLGRIHSAKQAHESVADARVAGFDNLNLDFMFALPDQELTTLGQDIERVLDFSPEHISLYGLSFEEGTPFFKQLQAGKLPPCDENLYADQYQLLHEQLGVAGFEHYEISNFARPKQRCRHNQVYWQRGECLAIGAGGHSFIDREWGERWHIPASLNGYKESLLQGENPAELLETYDQRGAMKEFVYLALRTSDGINLGEFRQKFNCTLAQVFPAAIDRIRPFLDSPANSDHHSFNQNGWLIYDHLISHFL